MGCFNVRKCCADSIEFTSFSVKIWISYFRGTISMKRIRFTVLYTATVKGGKRSLRKSCRASFRWALVCCRPEVILCVWWVVTVREWTNMFAVKVSACLLLKILSSVEVEGRVHCWGACSLAKCSSSLFKVMFHCWRSCSLLISLSLLKSLFSVKGPVRRWRSCSFLKVIFSAESGPTGSPSRGGDVTVCGFDINQPILPTPFYSVLVTVSVLTALSNAFQSVNSPSNSSLSHSVLWVSFLLCWFFQPYIYLWTPSARIQCLYGWLDLKHQLTNSRKACSLWKGSCWLSSWGDPVCSTGCWNPRMI